ncbi:MAG: ExbD/TolR family protein [Prevotella sp.]|jgi:biopolymer transport protein ExbD
MSRFNFHRHHHRVPSLNTAALPDLIFTVLFFFMIVTHMRKQNVMVKYQVPQGTELTRLTKKSTVSYIYIGKPESPQGKVLSQKSHIQMNDKYVKADEVEDYMTLERNRMEPEDVDKMMVSIKADRQTPMGTITDVKQALRRAKALRISYSATEKK